MFDTLYCPSALTFYQELSKICDLPKQIFIMYKLVKTYKNAVLATFWFFSAKRHFEQIPIVISFEIPPSFIIVYYMKVYQIPVITLKLPNLIVRLLSMYPDRRGLALILNSFALSGRIILVSFY